MSDRRILQWDIREDRNVYPDGPLAMDKALYTFSGWEGCHRGSLLLTKEEAAFIIERLTSADPSPQSIEMDEDDRTPMPDGYDTALWRKADEVHHAMALVAKDEECVKILYTALSPETNAQPYAWTWTDATGCMFITGDGRRPDVPADAKPLYEHPAPQTRAVGDGEAAIIECLAAGEPFVFDPATNFLHADDGTVEGGIRYLPAPQEHVAVDFGPFIKKSREVLTAIGKSMTSVPASQDRVDGLASGGIIGASAFRPLFGELPSPSPFGPKTNSLGDQVQRALQEQVDACICEDCEMCYRHRDLLDSIRSRSESEEGLATPQDSKPSSASSISPREAAAATTTRDLSSTREKEGDQ